MSQISLKSISGITSITTPAGVDNVFSIHKNDTTEVFRIDQSGNQNVSGIITASQFKGDGSQLTGIDATAIKDSGGNVKIQAQASGAVYTGIHTFSSATFSSSIDIGSNIKIGNAGVVTATSYNGSGASLTNLNASNIASGTVPTARLGSGTASSSTFLRGDSTFAAVPSTNIVNNASGRLVVGSNTANTLDAKSEATYNGTKLFLSGGVGQDQHVPMLELKHLNTAYSSGNGDGPAILLNGYYASNEWALAKIAAVNAGGQYGSGYGGGLQFWVHPANGTQTASVIKGAEIIGDGSGANLTINDGNLVIGTGGHGIDFSADSSGTLQTLANNFNAEVLHDYEVGTFVPNIQYDTGTNQYYGSPGSGHYVASSKGEYIRIGDMMFAAGQITLTGNRNSTQTVHISIGGMPYNGLHSSQQNSLMTGWGGAAWPKNDNNVSYRLIYSYHNYTTLNFYFKQNSGNNGIDGFNFHVYYRCPT